MPSGVLIGSQNPHPECGFFSTKQRLFRSAPHLDQHDVSTTFVEGWAMLKNGDLLKAAEQAGFDVLLTTDKNLRYQQNLTHRKIAILVLGVQQWPQLSAPVRRVVEAVNSAVSGSYVEIEIPDA